MIITNDKVLDDFRGPGVCHYCGKYCVRREAHHVHTKGTLRIDIPINLAALGGPFDCACHDDFHNGRITRGQIIAKVAEREGITSQELVSEIWRIRRLPKGSHYDPQAGIGPRQVVPYYYNTNRRGASRSRDVRPGVFGPSPDGGIDGVETDQGGR